jgi:hypothetical protein
MMVRVKGQVAFESLFIVLVIMSAAVYITMLCMDEAQNTPPTAMVRDELFSQTLDMNTNVLLKHVSIDRNYGIGAPTIVVRTDPETIRSADFNWDPIRKKLSKSMSTFRVNVNDAIDANPR